LSWRIESWNVEIEMSLRVEKLSFRELAEKQQKEKGREERSERVPLLSSV